MTTYLLAGGGTAGHVNPLLALADYIRDAEPDCTIIVLGTRQGLEARLVPERGYELVTIDRLPFPRRPTLDALAFPVKYARAVQQVRRLLRARGVDVVVGFGGYVCPPAYRAAKREGIPSVVHEANAKPGLANIMGARSAAAVAVTFEGTPIRGAVVTGMPLRPEIATLDRASLRASARAELGLDPLRRTLLVTGGSLGARALNEGLSSQAEMLTGAGIQVFHVWGGLTDVRDPGVPGYHVVTYCDRMDLAFAACDLVVSRAGSTTVSEISGLGIPAVFVPYNVGNGEQRYNAASTVAAGGALLVEDEGLTPSWVREVLIPLTLDDERLSNMAERSSRAGSLRGTERLFELVQGVLR